MGDQWTADLPLVKRTVESYDERLQRRTINALIDQAASVNAKTDGWLDVVADYGAIGDGSTDDTTAIQNALTAAAGGVCFIPVGTFIVSDALTIPANTRIQGAGKYLTILKWADGAGDMTGAETGNTQHEGLLFIDTVSNVSIQDLTVDCNKAGQSAGTNLNGLVIWSDATSDIAEFRIQNCVFKNATANQNGNFGNGIRVSGATNPSSGISRISVEDCDFDSIDTSYGIQFSQTPEHCTIRGNRFRSCTFGMDFSTGQYSTVVGNTFIDCTSAALVGQNLNNATISGNVIDNCETGFLCDTGGTGGGLVVTGNFFYGEATARGAGINLKATGHNGRNTITGNYIERFQRGIYLNGQEYCAVSGNVIRALPTGIELSNDANRNNITGNVIAATTVGVLLGSSTTNNNVTQNGLGGSSTAVTDNGTNNTITPNNTD